MPAGVLIVETQIRIARAPQDVFDLLVDPANWSALDESLLEVSPREIVVPGTGGTMRRRVGLGLTVKTKWRNTAFVPGARLENLITGFGYEMRELIVLAADARGTEATVTDTLTPTSPVGRAMVALSRGIIERDLQARYAKLKSVLEAGSGRED